MYNSGMKRIATKKVVKKEAYFIATRYRNEPLDVSFYTKDGEWVGVDAVEKKRTKEGVKFFVVAE